MKLWIEFRKDIYNEGYLNKIGINDIGKTTSTEELSKLVELELLVSSGTKGRGANYTLNLHYAIEGVEKSYKEKPPLYVCACPDLAGNAVNLSIILLILILYVNK